MYKLGQVNVIEDHDLSYTNIGHNKYFNGLNKNCEEWIWLWDGHNLLVEEATRDNDHRKVWEKRTDTCFRGRASKCNNKISINCPYKGSMKLQPPESLLQELERYFPDMKAYIF
jgi:hypothetical protein